MFGTGQLTDIATTTGWGLPADFIELIEIQLYNSDDEPLYMGTYNYKHEITNSKLYIYTTESTPITGLDTEIDEAYILYSKSPSLVNSLSSSFGLASEFHDGILAGAYHKLFLKYPVEQIINNNVVLARDYRAAQLWEKEFDKVRKKLKKRRYSNQDGTHHEAQQYQYAGKFELPKRIKDSAGSAVGIQPISTLYTKYARWTLTYPSTVTVITAATGFTGTVTGVIAGGQLTLTSSASEFSNVIDWNANQEDVLVNSFSAGTWVFDLPAGDFGSMRFEIFE